jgi:hypothetical protein
MAACRPLQAPISIHDVVTHPDIQRVRHKSRWSKKDKVDCANVLGNRVSFTSESATAEEMNQFTTLMEKVVSLIDKSPEVVVFTCISQWQYLLP